MSDYYEEENKCILPDIHCLKFDRCEICIMSYSKGKTDAIEELTEWLVKYKVIADGAMQELLRDFKGETEKK